MLRKKCVLLFFLIIFKSLSFNKSKYILFVNMYDFIECRSKLIFLKVEKKSKIKKHIKIDSGEETNFSNKN